MSGPKLESHHVLIQFGDGIGPDAQGRAMLALERFLRTLTDEDIRVFKSSMDDDSKLRRAMTAEQRAKL